MHVQLAVDITRRYHPGASTGCEEIPIWLGGLHRPIRPIEEDCAALRQPVCFPVLGRSTGTRSSVACAHGLTGQGSAHGVSLTGPPAGRGADQAAMPFRSGRARPYGVQLPFSAVCVGSVQWHCSCKGAATCLGRACRTCKIDTLCFCQDMHPAWEVEEVRRLASGTLEIRAAQGNTPPRQADGGLVLSLKRRTGGSLASSPGNACMSMHALPLFAKRKAGARHHWETCCRRPREG